MEQTYSRRVAAEVRAEAGRRDLNSQSALARLTGLSQPTVRRYFYSCEREPTIDALVLVAQALGTTASELMRRAEEAGTTPQVKRPNVRRLTPKASRQPGDGSE